MTIFGRGPSANLSTSSLNAEAMAPVITGNNMAAMKPFDSTVIVNRDGGLVSRRFELDVDLTSQLIGVDRSSIHGGLVSLPISWRFRCGGFPPAQRVNR